MFQFFAALASSIAFMGATPTPTIQADGPYKVLRTVKVGGDGGFDYVYADSDGRKLYIARSGPTARMTAFDLDTLAPVGTIDKTPGVHGAAVDTSTHHGFASSKPVTMWDTQTMATMKTIDVQGRPDGILGDAFNHRIYIFSHSAPNATVIDADSGSVVGTVDLGGAPEQAASDGQGHIYVDLEDKDSVAVLDATTLKVTATYSLDGKGSEPAGLGLDAKNNVLFVACHNQTMVMLDAKTGKVLSTLPIGQGVDGGGFNPNTMEAFSSQGDGSVTIIKETDPTTFVVEQTVKTLPGARTMTIDSKTGHLFLVTAEYGPAPAATPEGGRQRRPMIPGSFTIIEVGK